MFFLNPFEISDGISSSRTCRKYCITATWRALHSGNQTIRCTRSQCLIACVSKMGWYRPDSINTRQILLCFGFETNTTQIGRRRQVYFYLHNLVSPYAKQDWPRDSLIHVGSTILGWSVEEIQLGLGWAVDVEFQHTWLERGLLTKWDLLDCICKGVA
jgi:hypothetical protein